MEHKAATWFREFDISARRHGSAFPLRAAPGFCVIVNPPELKRAQGKPGADRTHGSRAIESTGVGPQVQPETPAFPAQWFYGLLRALPGDRAFLPPSFPRSLLPENLAPASGRQDHATSPSALRALVARTHPRPPHLTATFVTCATPL